MSKKSQARARTNAAPKANYTTRAPAGSQQPLPVKPVPGPAVVAGVPKPLVGEIPPVVERRGSERLTWLKNALATRKDLAPAVRQRMEEALAREQAAVDLANTAPPDAPKTTLQKLQTAATKAVAIAKEKVKENTQQEKQIEVLEKEVAKEEVKVEESRAAYLQRLGERTAKITEFKLQAKAFEAAIKADAATRANR